MNVKVFGIFSPFIQSVPVQYVSCFSFTAYYIECHVYDVHRYCCAFIWPYAYFVYVSILCLLWKNILLKKKTEAVEKNRILFIIDDLAEFRFSSRTITLSVKWCTQRAPKHTTTIKCGDQTEIANDAYLSSFTLCSKTVLYTIPPQSPSHAIALTNDCNNKKTIRDIAHQSTLGYANIPGLRIHSVVKLDFICIKSFQRRSRCYFHSSLFAFAHISRPFS